MAGLSRSPAADPGRMRRFTLVVLAACPLAAADTLTKPNVLFVLCDDLGWRDVGYVGNAYVRTPRLDALAAQGRVFTQAYSASPVCSPSRAALLTGRSPARLGLTDWLPGGKVDPASLLLQPKTRAELPVGTRTIAQRLGEAGWRCGWIGKWHLGAPSAKQHGFAVEVGNNGKGQPRRFTAPYDLADLADAPAGEYLTDRQGAEAVRFIRANATTPWFLGLSFYAPHTPLQAPAATVATYQARDEFAPEGSDRRSRAVDGHPTYAAMIEHLDRAVGAALDALRETGQDQRTIVVFTSDNGGLSTGALTTAPPSCNLPLRAGKAWTYEGGIRVPLLLRVPGLAPGTHAEPVIGTDLPATIATWCGLPDDAAFGHDGRSLAPLLAGAPWPERALVWHYPHDHGNSRGPSSALRLGRWKLRRDDVAGRDELYDLDADPGERNDLAAREPQRCAELAARLDAELTAHGAQRVQRKVP